MLRRRAAEGAARSVPWSGLALAVVGMGAFFAPPLAAVESETPKQKQSRLETRARLDRDLWQERAVGRNLAAGKKARLIPDPDYHLTRQGGSDATDLTDGTLSSTTLDRLWFDSKAVGWYLRPGLERFILIDLETVQPVEKAVIRCLGGSGHMFRFPRAFEVWVSKDGTDYFRASTLEKLMPAEASQADWERFYHLDETGEMYDTRTYPFQLDVRADARFVLLKITGETASVFADELVLLAAEHDRAAEFNAAYVGPARRFPLEGLVISTRWHELGIVRGIEIPQHFQVMDLRDDAPAAGGASDVAVGKGSTRTDAVEMIVEVPPGIEVSAGHPPETAPRWRSVTGTAIAGTDDRQFVYPLELAAKGFSLPKLYFTLTDEARDAVAPVRVYARCGGVDQYTTSLPVRIETLPPIEPFRKLHVSLAWMSERDQLGWPNFLENFRRLGFTAVSSFPRYWHRDDARNVANERFLDDARARGFQVVMNESPLHMMMRGRKAGDEIFCQKPGQPGHELCPTYRGDAYASEMDRVAQCVRRSRPDVVFFDIECWHSAAASAKTCSRCQEAFRRASDAGGTDDHAAPQATAAPAEAAPSRAAARPDAAAIAGRTLQDFLFAEGRGIAHDLHDAVVHGAQQAGVPTPVIGSYNRQPAQPVYAIERFDDIYPTSIDLAMPSLYVAGRERDVHRNIRENRRLLGENRLIPWLSAGCYGEFEPHKMEFLVLEALVNGAQGVTYYEFTDFDTPLDFFFHAKALAAIRPYENLLVDGRPIAVSGTNPDLLYSAIGAESAFLLLVGNPDRAEPSTRIQLPACAVPRAAQDLRDGADPRTLAPGEAFICNVPKDGIRLFLVRHATRN